MQMSVDNRVHPVESSTDQLVASCHKQHISRWVAGQASRQHTGTLCHHAHCCMITSDAVVGVVCCCYISWDYRNDTGPVSSDCSGTISWDSAGPCGTPAAALRCIISCWVPERRDTTRLPVSCACAIIASTHTKLYVIFPHRYFPKWN